MVYTQTLRSMDRAGRLVYICSVEAAMPYDLTCLPGEYAICQLPPDAPAAPVAGGSSFLSVTRTADELSVVCRAADAPPGSRVEAGWRCLKLAGPFAFDETGVLASVAAPLAAAGVGIFAISTYNTDYVLVKDAQLAAALDALRAAGHTVHT